MECLNKNVLFASLICDNGKHKDHHDSTVKVFVLIYFFLMAMSDYD
jgi:hypothetical protein